MFCSNCGKEIADNAVVCIHCGVATNLAPGIITPSAVGPRKVNGFGIAGFVIGVISLYFGVYFCIAPIVGLVFSILGMVQRRKFTSCNALAVAGLVLNIVALVFWLFIWIVYAASVVGMINGAVMY